MSEDQRWFELQPVDAWFFRDGRPSNRGEDQSDLQSIFPPHSPTVVGALRAALARQQGWTGTGDWPSGIKAVLGDGFDNLGRLSFVGPFLKRHDELLFVMPRHVLGHLHERDGQLRFEASDWLEPSDRLVACDGGDWILPLPPPPPPNGDKPPAPAEDVFVTASGLQRIVSGLLPEPEQCIHHSRLFTHESRVGIQRDEKTGTTGKAALYSPSYIRLDKDEDVALVMGIAGLPDDWSVPSLFPMGGESRLSTCRQMDGPPAFAKVPHGSDAALLILLTPAHFSDPPWWGGGPGDPANCLHHSLDDIIATAAIDRPLRIGGWDSTAKPSRPLPMRPYAPAGTVWWIRNLVSQSAPDPIVLGDGTAYGFGCAVYAGSPQGVSPSTTHGAHS